MKYVTDRWMNECVVHFRTKINFNLIFFLDRHTLKFLKMKYNPTNKKLKPNVNSPIEINGTQLVVDGIRKRKCSV